jgi:Na+-driven multidrug efflux pump
MKPPIDLTSGSPGRHILRMTPPMVTGFFALMALRLVGLVMPPARAGARLAGAAGIFAGMAAGQLLSGVVALLWFGRVLRARRAAAAGSPS